METSKQETQLKNPNDHHHQPSIKVHDSCKSTANEGMLRNSHEAENGVGDGCHRGEAYGCGREKLMRHWKEVSSGGKIVIPEKWGQEDLLKEWIDCSAFDALLGNNEAVLARQAIVDEARRRRSLY